MNASYHQKLVAQYREYKATAQRYIEEGDRKGWQEMQDAAAEVKQKIDALFI